jgi:subtilisin-like proprotein convertase family protein
LPGIRRALLLAVTAATLLLTMPIGDAMGFRNLSASPAVPPGAKLPEVTTDEFTLLPALPIRPTAPNAINAGAFSTEVEPNGTTATAQLLTGKSVRLRGNIQLATDLDFYKIAVTAGDRLYVASATTFSSGGSGLTGDGTLEVYGTDGTTLLESDNDDGSFAATSPSIAGLVLPTTGVIFIKMRHSSAAPASEIDPYDLYVKVQSGAPATESEPNNNGGAPNPLPASGWISGTIDPAGPPIDNDTFSLSLNAGDTVFLSLDANPERDATTFNPRLGFGIFDNSFLLADGSAAVSPNSEAFFFTVRNAATYVIYVDTAVAGAGPTATYRLSASVYPRDTDRTYTTYTSTDVPQTIPVATGLATSTLTVPGSPKIGNLRVGLNITHSALGELDISLVAPDGNEVVIMDDPPAAAAGTTAPQIDSTYDDEAGLPASLFGINKPMVWQPESLARLGWFKNQNAGGLWRLNVRDDAGIGSGTLNGWSIDVGVDPGIPPCTGVNTNLYTQNFEANDGGYTHSGTADEWEYGTPSFAPITTAHSGTKAWKTDLDNTYNNAPTGMRVDQTLLSPSIVLTGMTGARINFEWAMKYNIEGSNWDRAFVEIREVGGGGLVRRYFEHAGPTMTRTVGSPAVTLNTAAGWGVWDADISEFAGKTVQAAFGMSQDDSVALTGLAIDDVKVDVCQTVSSVKLSSFAAKAARGGANLTWKSASETGLLGFDVYGQTKAGQRVKLNRSLILSTTGLSGGSYHYTYRGKSAYARYWLRSAFILGKHSWHGPAVVRRR